MKTRKIMLPAVAILGFCCFLYGFGTQDISAEQSGGLSVLIESGGEFTELNIALTADELYAYMDEDAVSLLLEGGPVRLTTQESMGGVLELFDLPDGLAIDNIFIQYATEVPATWTCVKCCYHDPPLACCCKPKDDDGGGDE